jgi:hypothetical protein
MWWGIKSKTAEVIDDFLERLKTASHELKKQLVEAQGAREFSEYSITEARAECGSYQRMETGADP